MTSSRIEYATFRFVAVPQPTMQARNPFIPLCTKLKLIEIGTDLSKGSGNEIWGLPGCQFEGHRL